MTTDAATDPPGTPEDASITDNVGASQYEIHIGDVRAAIAAYSRTTDAITFTHTEVSPDFEGKGLAGKIAKVALDAARSDGLRVVPQCSFFAEYIRRHPAYQDLVDT
ncbi:MAG: GNAT family N-acetyltransferase [Ilumatobacteraceae bacterium]